METKSFSRETNCFHRRNNVKAPNIFVDAYGIFNKLEAVARNGHASFLCFNHRLHGLHE